jgi:uncharacterized membrane protein YozB (DUF420 family)
MIQGTDLPLVNATLNSTSTILLLAGYWAVRSRRFVFHRRLMFTAIGTSTAFLASYLFYHFVVKLQTPYAGPPQFRTAYLWLLGSHTILAMLVLPLVIATTLQALKAQKGDSDLVSPEIRERFLKHRRIARWTFPIWLYVSVTGVIIYWILYQLPKI